MSKPYRQHLHGADDLVTTYEEIRAGFVALALEKNRQATPFVEEARALKAAAQRARAPLDLLDISDIQEALLTAAGLSDKAVGHLLPEDLVTAKKGLIKRFLEPAGLNFVEELVFRFLLTRGDTLGGSMRNIGGALAQRKLTRSILAALTLAKVPYHWLHNNSKDWIPMSENDADIELHLRGLAWNREGRDRTMIYNLTVPLVRNNIDLCLLNCTSTAIGEKTLLTDPKLYIAFGELKGGIDPAGADEHWKTARSALERIRRAFASKRCKPLTFFVGAAIEKRMAEEIWGQLKSGILTNAANLTGADQLASLCSWFSSL
jgi:type II restriction enzyme